MNRNIELECKKSPLLGNQQPSSFLVRDGEGSSTILLREYTQVSGNGEVPEMECDIVKTSLKDEATQRRFYVYVYLDPRRSGLYKYGEYSFEYEPFYVGKGMGSRIFVHTKIIRQNKVAPHLNLHSREMRILDIFNETKKYPFIIKVLENLTNDESILKEIELISLMGREDKGTGILTNRTYGGESGVHCNPDFIKLKRKEFLENNPMWNPEYSRKLKGDNNGARLHPERNLFVSSNPMKDFETASKVNKIRRSKADPLKVSRAVSESNRDREWTSEMRAKQKKNCTRGGNPFFGRTHSSESILKMKETKRLKFLQKQGLISE